MDMKNPLLWKISSSSSIQGSWHSTICVSRAVENWYHCKCLLVSVIWILFHPGFKFWII